MTFRKLFLDMRVRKYALLKEIVKTGYIMVKLKFIAVERF